MAAIGIPASSSTLSTPMCTMPRAKPPPRATPSVRCAGTVLIFGGVLNSWKNARTERETWESCFILPACTSQNPAAGSKVAPFIRPPTLAIGCRNCMRVAGSASPTFIRASAVLGESLKSYLNGSSDRNESIPTSPSHLDRVPTLPPNFTDSGAPAPKHSCGRAFLRWTGSKPQNWYDTQAADATTAAPP